VCNYVVKNEGKNILHVKTKSYKQCLGSGSVGSARFGFLDPDPDPRGKKSTKNFKKTFEKKRDYKNFLISEWFIKF